MPKLDYQLRPSKAVVRHMLVEVCRRLNEIAPLNKYRYVGLGGLEFVDFDLIHRALGIVDMTSIERDTYSIARYEFNIPFKTVKVLAGTASEQLALLDWSALTIVWLDYESQLTREILEEDIPLLTAGLLPGSALFVTLNATPPRSQAGRRESLAMSIGEERIPSGVDDSGLAVWGLADVQRQVLTDAVVEGLRSQPRPAQWRQVFNAYYADDAKMQTLGGVVYDAATERGLDRCGFDELEFVRTGDDAVVVRVPMLTSRERLYLERQLPLSPYESLSLPGLTEEDVAAFLTVYRYQRAIGVPI